MITISLTHSGITAIWQVIAEQLSLQDRHDVSPTELLAVASGTTAKTIWLLDSTRYQETHTHHIGTYRRN